MLSAIENINISERTNSPTYTIIHKMHIVYSTHSHVILYYSRFKNKLYIRILCTVAFVLQNVLAIFQK